MHYKHHGKTYSALMIVVSSVMFHRDALQARPPEFVLNLSFASDPGPVSLCWLEIGGYFGLISSMLTVSDHWRVREHWTAK